MDKNLNGKPPYLLGLLGLFPLVGAFVGVALILYGHFKYRDRLLVIIGASCVIFTILIFSIIFYNVRYGKEVGKEYAKISQMQLSDLVKDVELYKLQTGYYPDSLKQLRKYDRYVVLTDPLLVRKMSRHINVLFHYQRLDSIHYVLFSVGLDGIPNTADDIYPAMSQDSGRIGLVRLRQ